MSKEPEICDETEVMTRYFVGERCYEIPALVADHILALRAQRDALREACKAAVYEVGSPRHASAESTIRAMAEILNAAVEGE